MTLANVTEGAAKSAVLKVIQVEPSHGFVAWQALVDGYAPKSSNDPAVALQPILATPERCKDAEELKEKCTAWSLKVSEYEHHFKVIDAAQKTVVVREKMPKDIKRSVTHLLQLGEVSSCPICLLGELFRACVPGFG